MGIQVAAYETIALLDSDDFYHPDFLKLSLETFEAKPENTAFVYCGMADPEDYVAGARANKAEVWDIPSRFVNKTNPYLFELRFGTSAGIMIDRAAFVEAGQFDTRLKAAEDTDFFVRMAYKKVGCPVEYTLVFKDNSLTDRLTRDYEKNAKAYQLIIQKNKETIDGDPHLVRRWYYKYLWLNFYAGRRKEAWGVFRQVFMRPAYFSVKIMLVTLVGLFSGSAAFRKIHKKLA